MEWIAAICINGFLYNLERPAHLPEGHQAAYLGWSYPTGESCIARKDVEATTSGESKFAYQMKVRKENQKIPMQPA